jgi:hypothetical protein
VCRRNHRACTAETLATTAQLFAGTAEKLGTTAQSFTSTAENFGTTARSFTGTAENFGTTAQSFAGTAENFGTTAQSFAGTAENFGTTTAFGAVLKEVAATAPRRRERSLSGNRHSVNAARNRAGSETLATPQTRQASREDPAVRGARGVRGGHAPRAGQGAREGDCGAGPEAGHDAAGEGSQGQGAGGGEAAGAAELLRYYYKDNLEKLIAVKKQYDPDSFFDFDMGIPAK